MNQSQNPPTSKANTTSGDTRVEPVLSEDTRNSSSTKPPADMPASDNSPTVSRSQKPRKRRWLRWLWRALIVLLLLLLTAFIALWVWSGREGSLAQTIGLVQRFVPVVAQSLEVDDVRGTLRDGGHIGRLRWHQENVDVQVSEIDAQWRLFSLFTIKLPVDQLHADRIQIITTPTEDKPPQTPSVPPQNLGLPLRIEAPDILVNTFIWGEESQGIIVSDIVGSYSYKNDQHHLLVNNLSFAQGRYHAEATLRGRDPELEATLTASLISAVPGDAQQLQVDAQARIQGLLTKLYLSANVQVLPVPATTQLPTAEPSVSEPPLINGHAAQPAVIPIPVDTSPETASAETAYTLPQDSSAITQQASVHATITPWADMPLPQADLKLQNIDASVFWPSAPQTLLTGSAQVNSTPNEPIPTWQVQSDIRNEHPGPFDLQQLPIRKVELQAMLTTERLTLQEVQIMIGDGNVTAQGHYDLPSRTATADDSSLSVQTSTQLPSAKPEEVLPTPASSPWQVDVSINSLNPQTLYTSIGKDLLDGSLHAEQTPQALIFDATVKPVHDSANSTHLLQHLAARGRWAQETLTLEALELNSTYFALHGEGTYALKSGALNGQFDLDAPGIEAQARIDHLSATDGNLNAILDMRDAKKTLEWLQGIPIVPQSIRSYLAEGTLALSIDAKGGWQNPTVASTLKTSRLRLAQKASTETPEITELLNLSDTHLELEGKIASARLQVKATAMLHGQVVEAELLAQGGMQNGNLDVQISQLESSISKLPEGSTRQASAKPLLSVQSQKPFQIRWQESSERLSISPGILTLQVAAGDNSLAPSFAWDDSSWQAGNLSTSGKITAFPVLWLTTLTNTKIADLDLKGDLTLEGAWHIQMGENLDFSIEIARTGGDLSLEPEGNIFNTGKDERLQAGVRQASIKLYNEGENIHAELVWDSEEASIIYLKASTAMTKSGNSWSLSPDAPLSGEAIVQLPHMGMWSALAPTGWRFSGAAILDSKLGGTLWHPELRGRLTAMDVSMRSVLDGIEFTDGNLQMTFDGNRVVLNDFSFKGAGAHGGSLKANGSFDWGGETALAEMHLAIDRLRTSIRSDRQLTASGKASITLKNRELSVNGDLTVNQALIILESNTGGSSLDSDVVVMSERQRQLDEQARQREQEIATLRESQPRITPKVHVTLDLGRNFRIQGYGLQSYLRGNLLLTNQGLNPLLIGQINTFNGRFRAYAQSLNIESGEIVFSGPYDNPTLNILAVRPNLPVVAGVRITGTASHPSVSMYSDSGLSNSEILSWVVLGRSASADGTEAAVLQQAALALLSGSGPGITDQLASALGLDEISIGGSSNSTANSNPDDDSLANTTITVSKRLSDNFYVSYEHSLNGAMGTFFVFYEISRRLTLRGEGGENNAVDLIYTFRFDGKKPPEQEPSAGDIHGEDNVEGISDAQSR